MNQAVTLMLVSSTGDGGPSAGQLPPCQPAYPGSGTEAQGNCLKGPGQFSQVGIHRRLLPAPGIMMYSAPLPTRSSSLAGSLACFCSGTDAAAEAERNELFAQSINALTEAAQVVKASGLTIGQAKMEHILCLAE